MDNAVSSCFYTFGIVRISPLFYLSASLALSVWFSCFYISPFSQIILVHVHVYKNTLQEWFPRNLAGPCPKRLTTSFRGTNSDGIKGTTCISIR